jgi:hypothetical protein
MFLGWMLIGLSFSVNDFAFRGMLADYYKSSPSLPSIVFWDLVYWPMWAALTPLILIIARRFPLARNSWHPNLLINLAAWLLLPVLQRIIYLLIAWPLQKALGEQTSFRDLLLYNLPMGLMICGVILLVSHLINYFREEELRASRLKTELTQAQLAALKMQLQPHFLFNTLSYISAQLNEDVKAADKMLAQLGDFLRLTLDNSGAQAVTLEAELDFLRCYLDIVKVRLEDRLQVSYELEPQTLAAQVPNLILQPIIENVIKHGVGQSFGQVQIVVSARHENGKLRLQIKDNGESWQGNGDGYAEGFGISNTRARLKSAYGSDGQFDLTRAQDGWTVASLEMPLVTEAADSTAAISR